MKKKEEIELKEEDLEQVAGGGFFDWAKGHLTKTATTLSSAIDSAKSITNDAIDTTTNSISDIKKHL